MSEKIYTWLLRVFPAAFREVYGEEALQLFRDRYRDERGFFLRLRLWLDLLFDLAVSVPRMRRQGPVTGAAVKPAGPAPAFHVLDYGPRRRGSLLAGGILTLAVFAGCLFLMNHAGSFPSLIPLINQARLPTAYEQSEPQAGQANAAERHRVIQGVISKLMQYYVDKDAAQMIAEALPAAEERGEYDGISDGAAFARLLTSQIRDLSHDLHLEVVYSSISLPNPRTRRSVAPGNCAFETAGLLPHNIGYVKLNSFPDPLACRPAAVAAMASLNQADAIIFDLRDNRGGSPGMVMLLAAYLFDHPEYMYNPRENTTERSWTQSPVRGNKLADKPVYILTSSRTRSGGEHFSYDLKMLKRATLIGETTTGASDVGVFHRIDNHFGIGIRETNAINPYSTPDWAVKGVEPDVRVPAGEALTIAENLAERQLQYTARSRVLR